METRYVGRDWSDEEVLDWYEKKVSEYGKSKNWKKIWDTIESELGKDEVGFATKDSKIIMDTIQDTLREEWTVGYCTGYNKGYEIGGKK